MRVVISLTRDVAAPYTCGMRLAFSTNAFTRYPLSYALQRIRAAGYEGVEILADIPHAYPGTLNSSLILEAAREVERLRLQVSNINANCTFGFFRDPPPEAFFEPSLISPNPRWRDDRIRMIGKAMELAKAVGADCVSITSGKMLGSISPTMADRLLNENLKRVLDLADKWEMKVGIECEPGLFIEYAEELRAWIDRIGHPLLGANLDIGHSQVLGEDIPSAIRLLADRIWNLHVEDIPGRKHYHLISGEGTMDWATVGNVLKEIGYNRWITVELYTQTERPDEAAVKSREFLRARMFEED